MSALRRRDLILVASAPFLPASLFALVGRPNKPVHIVVPFVPAGTTDILARALAPELGKAFITDNKLGAGDNLGADATAKSPPGGYDLLMGTGRHARDQCRAVLEDALRSGARFRAHRAGGRRA